MKITRLREFEGDWAEFCILCSREEIETLLNRLDDPPEPGFLRTKMADEMRKELSHDPR